METLFMIGNGFDVNCGMKTKYRDAYPEYISIKENDETLKHFKEEIEENIENWGDFEISMAKYAEQLNDENAFIECVSDFVSFLGGYLSRQQESFYKRIMELNCLTDICEEMKKSIKTFYEGISENINREMERRNANSLGNIEVISFNYTSVFDKFFYQLYGESFFGYLRVNHIHGGNDVPVLGMDNEKQITLNSKPSKNFKRSFIKPFFNSEYDIDRVKDAENKIKEANTICVYGMSLGDSDLTWRNMLLEWLKSGSSNHLFIYDYNYSKKQYKTVPNRMADEDKAKTKILNSWGVEQVDSFVEQFHVVCGKNIFNIGDVIKKSEEKRRRIDKGKRYVGDIISEK